MNLKSPPFSFVTRQSDWARLDKLDWDLLVIGGGISGAACARDAQLRGLKTLLVESDDFASGTSSGSSKLIHGGVRYLKNKEFKLVFTAIQERERLIDLYAPLVTKLDFVFPTYEAKFPNRWMLNLGLHVYDAFSGFRERHTNINRKKTIDRYPLLEDTNLSGSVVYMDAFAEDFRLVIEIIKSAHRAGATCLNRVSAEGFEFQNNLHHVRILDRVSAHEKVIRARKVINCAGPFSDEIRQKLKLKDRLVLTQGVHFLVPRSKFPIQEAYVMSDPHNDRILFAIPWRSATYFGTTDTPISNISDVRARKEDLDYVLSMVNKTFNLEVRAEDVFQSWAAVRPLIRPPEMQTVSKVSREHEIVEEPHGIFHLLGGKLTSHREMAEEILDQIAPHFPNAKKCLTRKIPLQDEYFKGEASEDLETRYGRFASDVSEWDKEKNLERMKITQNLPFRVAEIYYAIHHEMALEPIDFLRRRTSLFYERTDPSIIEAVSSVFKVELGKNDDWLKKTIAATQKIYDWDSQGFK